MSTPEFKELAAFLRECYVKGITDPNGMNAKPEDYSNHFGNGDWPFAYIGGPMFAAPSVKKAKPDANLVEVMFQPQKLRFRGQWIYMNANAVPSTTRNPEAGIMFFNWLYSNSKYTDLLNYGIQGRHWNPAPNRRYTALVPPEVYNFGDWEFQHYKLVRMATDAPAVLEPTMFQFDESAVNSVIYGFRFDPTPVNAEFTALRAELQSTVWPIKYGMIDYESNYDKMMSALNAAGYQKVLAEYTRQFNAWRANKQE